MGKQTKKRSKNETSNVNNAGDWSPPMDELRNTGDQEGDIEDKYLNCSSTMDCTGSVPRAPRTAAEWESYEDLTHFEPHAVKKNITEFTTAEKKISK